MENNNNNEDSALIEKKSTEKDSLTTSVPILMKKGDYTVHILIEEVKNLISANENLLPYPIVKMTCFDKSQRTKKTKERCRENTFNEHFYFEKTDLTVEMLDSAKIIIEVYDYNHSSKTDYFGIYELDFEYIYSKTNHSIKNLWIALANPESKDITKVNGYLKLSISILNTEDEKIELNPDVNNNSDCMIPPQIKTVYQQLNIYIFKGEGLPDMNASDKESNVNRSCNGFIELKYMGISLKTNVVDMKNDVINWNEILSIPVNQPTISQKLVFTVWDKNKLLKDSSVGTFEISIQEIFENKFSFLRCVDIYGSVKVNDKSKMAELMNTNAEIGSRWKGRIWLMIKYKEIDTPEALTRPIEDKNLIETIEQTSRTNQWSIYVKLYDAFYLPSEKDKFSIRISIQENTQLFNEKQAQQRNINWNLVKTLQCLTLTENKYELPDLFIYLLDSKKNIIAFQRIPASLFHLNDDILMIKLYPEPCVNKIKEMYLSGIVKIRIKIFNSKIDPPEQCKVDSFKDGDEFNTSNPNLLQDEDDDDLEKKFLHKKDEDSYSIGTKLQNASFNYYTIVANIFMTRYLVAGDKTGTSDPFVTLRVFNESKKTSTKKKCVNGIWNESLYFDNVYFDINNQSTWPVMLLSVMDEDLVGDDLLGYCYIWLSDCSYRFNSTEKILPQWTQLYLEKSNRAQGQILISFYILDSEHRNSIYNLNIQPETIPYTVEINALGLRELKPLSFIPVKKAFISFDLNSINVSAKDDGGLEPIKTLPKLPGSNPNINSVIKFNVKLPVDEIFIPELQCNVYDHVLGGLLNQLLGIFLVDVKKIIQETNAMFENHYKLAKDTKVSNKNLNEYVKNNNLINDNNISNNNNENIIDKEDKEIEMKEINQESLTYLCQVPDDLNSLYKGKINEDDLNNNKFNSKYIVIKPAYKTYTVPGVKKGDKKYKEYLIEDEKQIPPDSLYMSIGYNKNQNEERIQISDNLEFKLSNLNNKNIDITNNKKHYRRIYGKELEKVDELGLATPFLKCNIIRGKYSDKKSDSDIFDAMSDIDNKIIKRFPNNNNILNNLNEIENKDNLISNDEENYVKNISKSFDLNNFGCFKGLIRIGEKEKMKEYNNFKNSIRAKFNNSIPTELNFLDDFDNISKNILITHNVIVRIYILELNNLPQKDIYSESDPYIKILLGNKVEIDEKENYKKDAKNCKWYKYYDILTELPGNSTVTIQVYDYDNLFNDDFIGETTIDIEDRYFDRKWQNLKNKPIEVRSLFHPDFESSQGSIKLWIEMFEKDQRTQMIPWNISPEPESLIECRLIVWETEEMENLDVEDTSDIYVTAFFDQNEKQSTDIHYRCQNGCGSFNYRMVFPIKLPRNKYDLTLYVYDNDILARDDFICGARLNLYGLISKCNVLDIPLTFNKEYLDTVLQEDNNNYQNIEFLSNSDDADGKKFWIQCEKNGKKTGRILCSIEVLPDWKATTNPVGKGRDSPNVDPYLPPPVGRISFSLNPFTMLNQLVGPKFRKKCYCFICCFLLVLYLIFVLPYIIWFLGGEIINPFNYTGNRKAVGKKL